MCNTYVTLESLYVKIHTHRLVIHITSIFRYAHLRHTLITAGQRIPLRSCSKFRTFYISPYQHINLQHINQFVQTHTHTQLISLNLSKNRLTSLEFESTSLLPNLEFLDLSFNGLKDLNTLPSHSLTTLNLSNNRLVDVSFSSTSLRSLNLSNNALETVPSALGTMTTLVSLDLSGNLLSNVQDIHKNLPCKTLSRLNLSNNRLDCVSSLLEFQSLASFTSLSSLNLAGNPLEDFVSSRNIDIRPFLLFLLPNLRVLDRLDVSDRTRQYVIFERWCSRIPFAHSHKYRYFKDETRRMDLVTSMAEMRLDSYLSSVCVLIKEEVVPEVVVSEDMTSTLEEEDTKTEKKKKSSEKKKEKKPRKFVEVPLKQFRKLQHHVAEMRRYLRVWIRQERQRRIVAATRIQRWVRGVLTRRTYLFERGVRGPITQYKHTQVN